jgi:hypothetical protein
LKNPNQLNLPKKIGDLKQGRIPLLSAYYLTKGAFKEEIIPARDRVQFMLVVVLLCCRDRWSIETHNCTSNFKANSLIGYFISKVLLGVPDMKCFFVF